jgi:hypothetical protein
MMERTNTQVLLLSTLILLSSSSHSLEAGAVEPISKNPAARASKQFGNILVGYAPGALLISEGNSAVLMTRITTKRKRTDLVIQVHETFLNSFHKPGISTQRVQIPDEVVRVFLAPSKTLIWSRDANSPSENGKPD